MLVSIVVNPPPHSPPSQSTTVPEANGNRYDCAAIGTIVDSKKHLYFDFVGFVPFQLFYGERILLEDVALSVKQQKIHLFGMHNCREAVAMSPISVIAQLSK